MVRGLDGVDFGTVAIQLNDILYVATRPYGSHDFVHCVFACAVYDRCLLGCVRIHVTITGASIFVNASTS